MGGKNNKKQIRPYVYLQGEDGLEVVLSENDMVNVMLSSSEDFIKRAPEIVPGDNIIVEKVIIDLNFDDLEKIILQSSERYARAKNTYLKIFEGGTKVPMLMYLLTQAYAVQLEINPDNLAARELQKEERGIIAAGVHNSLENFAEENGVKCIGETTIKYQWLKGTTLMPMEKNLLVPLSEINSGFDKFKEAFLEEKNEKLVLYYHLFRKIKNIISKFLPKYVTWLDSVKENAIETIDDALSSAPKGNKEVDWLYKWIDTTPEIKAILKYFDSKGVQKTFVRVKSVKRLDKNKYMSKKQDLELDPINKVRGKVKTTRHEKVNAKGLLEINSVFDSIFDQVAYRYLSSKSEQVTYPIVPTITQMTNRYFGAKNPAYELIHKLIQEEGLGSIYCPETLEYATGFIEDVIEGHVDKMFKLEPGSLLKFVETCVRVKNALPKAYWKCEELGRAHMLSEQHPEMKNSWLKRYLKDFEKNLGKSRVALEKIGFVSLERTRLLTTLVFESASTIDIAIHDGQSEFVKLLETMIHKYFVNNMDFEKTFKSLHAAGLAERKAMAECKTEADYIAKARQHNAEKSVPLPSIAGVEGLETLMNHYAVINSRTYPDLKGVVLALDCMLPHKFSEPFPVLKNPTSIAQAKNMMKKSGELQARLMKEQQNIGCIQVAIDAMLKEGVMIYDENFVLQALANYVYHAAQANPDSMKIMDNVRDISNNINKYVRQAYGIAATHFIMDYVTVRDPLAILENQNIMIAYKSIVQDFGSNLLSEEKVNNILEKYDISGCKNFIHPNNFV